VDILKSLSVPKKERNRNLWK